MKKLIALISLLIISTLGANTARAEFVTTSWDANTKISNLQNFYSQKQKQYDALIELGKMASDRSKYSSRRDFRKAIINKAKAFGSQTNGEGAPAIAKEAAERLGELEAKKSAVSHSLEELTSLSEKCKTDDDGCVKNVNQWLGKNMSDDSNPIGQPNESPSLEISDRDKRILKEHYGVEDISKLSCEEFKEFYKKEALTLPGGIIGGLLPGSAQLLRGQAQGVLYGLGAVASGWTVCNPFIDPSIRIIAGLAYQTLGILSVYDAYKGDPFRDERMFKDKPDDYHRLVTAPANLSLLNDPEIKRNFPLYVAAARGFQTLAEHTIGNSVSPGNEKDLEKMFNFVGSGGIAYRLIYAAGVSYAAAVGEEALFRGILLPALEEKMLRQKLITPEDIKNNQCAMVSTSSVMDRLATLPPEEQKKIRNSARNWGNLFQTLLFATAHGNPRAPGHLIAGYALGQTNPEDSASLEKGTFEHFWYDFLYLSTALLSWTVK